MSLLATIWAVPANSPYDFYTLCYVLAFAVNLVLLIWLGYRRGYPLRTWLVLLACTTLMFIIGTKLLALSRPEWHALLHTGAWPTSTARTVLGGALAGTLTLLALRRTFGFSWHVFDVFTLPMCAALVVQCVGCVLTGCCFGELTDGTWGLTYPPNTVPYLAQQYRGLLPAGAAHSLPVHPTQLYSLLLCVAVGGVLLLVRHRSWAGGSWRLLHLGLLLAGRFLIEFWRDPAGEQVGAETHAHLGMALKQVQWALVLLFPLALGWWYWLVRRTHRHPAAPELVPVNHPMRNLLAVAGLLLLTAWLGPQALTVPEVLVIKALLLAVVVLEGGALLWQPAASPGRVALPWGLACAVLVLTSQAPADSSAGQREIYYTMSAAWSAGSFQRQQNTNGGCGGSSPLLPYEHRYNTGTLEVAKTSLPGTDKKGNQHKAEITTGLRLHLGTDRQRLLFVPDSITSYIPIYKSRTPLASLNFYTQVERKYYGMGMGVLLGSLGYHRLESGDETSVLDVQLNFRLGSREAVFAQYDYNYLGYGVANPQQRLGVGTGFGGTRWQLLAGAASAKGYDILPGASRWSGFGEVRGQFTRYWGGSAFALLGNPTQRQVGFRLSRRLGK